MARPYSMDLRERAMARLAAGETSREVAAALKVAVSSVVKWAARQRSLGSVAPGRMGGHRPCAISGEHRLFVLEAIRKTPHLTLQGLCEALAARGLCVHPATVGRFLARERQSYKKNHSGRRTEPIRRGAPAGALGPLSRAD
jgi:putative transposase